MSLPLTGKVALVTGASRGVGAEIAKRLAADGASVAVNYFQSAEAAEAVVQEINALGKGKAVAVKADVFKLDEGKWLIEETVAIFGRLDILVFNAAYKKVGALDKIDEQIFDAHYNANVKIPLFMTKAASKHLKAGARIIFITSSTTKISAIPPDYLLYISSKGTDEQMVRVLAKDFGARGITVNAVAPGPVDTEFFRNDGKTEQYIEAVKNWHPQKRIPLAHEIAPLVAFIAREEAGWVNGQSIMVNGGLAV